MDEFTKEIITQKVTLAIKEKYFQEVNKERKVTLDIAKKLMKAVEEKAESMNLNITVAISNEAGSCIAVHFMDGALPISLDVAMKKSYTVVALRMTTEELGRLVQPGNPFYGLQSSDNRIITFGGGCPLKVQGEVIGGIGVSGSTVENDKELAEYGNKIFNKLLKNVE